MFAQENHSTMSRVTENCLREFIVLREISYQCSKHHNSGKCANISITLAVPSDESTAIVHQISMNNTGVSKGRDYLALSSSVMLSDEHLLFIEPFR